MVVGNCRVEGHAWEEEGGLLLHRDERVVVCQTVDIGVIHRGTQPLLINGRSFSIQNAKAHESINNIIPAHQLRWLAHQKIANLINCNPLLTRMPLTIRLLPKQRQEVLDSLNGLNKLIPVDLIDFELLLLNSLH